jgi:hypothetical protein
VSKDPEQEGYEAINTLVGSLAKAFGLEGMDAARAVETGKMILKLGIDAAGDRYVEATFQGKVAIVYPGGAKPEMDAEKPRKG